MKIAVAATSELHPDNAKTVYDSLLADLGASPSILFLYCSAEYDAEEITSHCKAATPETPLHGGTSCMGVMTQLGTNIEGGCGLAMLGVADPEGRYGVGAAPLGASPEQSAEEAVKIALEHADCPGEIPAMVWLTSARGCEEAVLRGIANVLGDDVPVAGGSAADSTVSGKWKQFANNQVYTNAVVVAVLFPSSEIMFAFHSGYEPTEARGIVTKAGGFEATNSKGIATNSHKRILYEIDGEPAATVYNEWIGGSLSDIVPKGGNILHLTTLHPLGRIAGHIGKVPYYQLSHPETITPGGALTLFSEIDKGDEIVLMQGTIDSLISRAGRVATSALETHLAKPEDVAGAMVVYCAGCMLTVQERLDEVVASFRNALPDVPFLGTFTFGEQGCFLNGENRHGNLMISVLLFMKNDA